MARTKMLNPAALASLTHGVALVTFAEVHAAAAWLLGADELPDAALRSPTLAARVRDLVLAQHPSMPTVQPASPAEGLAWVERNFAVRVPVARGA